MERLEAEENGTLGQYEAGTGVASSTVIKKTYGVESVDAAKSAGKLSWEEQKKVEAEKRKLEKEVSRIEGEIAKAEEEKSALDAKMGLPEIYSNGAKAKDVQSKIDAIVARIDQLNLDWEAAMEKLG